MLSHREPTVLTERKSVHLALDSGLLMSRGLKELRPRRIDYAKLAATLVLQSSRAGEKTPCAAHAFLPELEGRLDGVARLFAPLGTLELAHPFMPQLLDCFAAETGAGRRTLVAVCGEAPAIDTYTHERFAKSLAAQNRELELKVGRAIMPVAKHSSRYLVREGAPIFRHLVAEEKPGKAIVLQLEEPSLKQASRRWQGLVGKRVDELSRQPVDCAQGWGAGALVFNSSAATKQPFFSASAPKGTARAQRSVHVASIDLQFATDELTLETADQLVASAAAFVASAGLQLRDLRNVTYSVPYPIVAGYLASLLAQRRGTNSTKEESFGEAEQFPEFLFGWQPLLTCLEFVADARPPALLIHTGRFPIVHMVVIHD